MGALQGEQAAMELGVKHYISKPFQADVLQATVRVAIREAQCGEAEPGQSRKVWGGSTLFHSNADGGGSNNLISLGSQLAAVDKKLDGGIRLRTLCFIEGPSATGKSLICQYAATGALDAGHSVAYFTSQHTARSLESQVSSIGLDWKEAIKSEKLVVYPVQPPVTGQDSRHLLAELAVDMERVQRKHDIIILDAITNLASSSQEQAIIGFFTT